MPPASEPVETCWCWTPAPGQSAGRADNDGRFKARVFPEDRPPGVATSGKGGEASESTDSRASRFEFERNPLGKLRLKIPDSLVLVPVIRHVRNPQDILS